MIAPKIHPLTADRGWPPDPEAARRERIARAYAAVAGFGGLAAGPRLRQALDLARAYASTEASPVALKNAIREVGRAADEARARPKASVWTIMDARRAAVAADEHQAVRTVADVLHRAFDPAGCLTVPAVCLDPAWLTSAVVALARVVAQAGRTDVLPILADALEDAGCADPAILDHCRGPGPHTPDCWVPELILNQVSTPEVQV